MTSSTRAPRTATNVAPDADRAATYTSPHPRTTRLARPNRNSRPERRDATKVSATRVATNRNVASVPDCMNVPDGRRYEIPRRLITAGSAPDTSLFRVDEADSAWMTANTASPTPNASVRHSREIARETGRSSTGPTQRSGT
jgi:hypothetical protein